MKYSNSWKVFTWLSCLLVIGAAGCGKKTTESNEIDFVLYLWEPKTPNFRVQTESAAASKAIAITSGEFENRQEAEQIFLDFYKKLEPGKVLLVGVTLPNHPYYFLVGHQIDSRPVRIHVEGEKFIAIKPGIHKFTPKLSADRQNVDPDLGMEDVTDQVKGNSKSE